MKRVFPVLIEASWRYALYVIHPDGTELHHRLLHLPAPQHGLGQRRRVTHFRLDHHLK